MISGPILIQVSNLSKNFGDVQALRNLTVDISSKATGLLGPNGAGKSTLIKLLLGLIPPNSGDASVLGYSIHRDELKIRQNIGYMPESDCFIPNMTGITFLTYFGQLSGLSPGDAMQRAHESLYYVNIFDERYRLISTYSTGMKQKIKLAQALTHDPDLIFLDEPTTGLDPIGRTEMLGLLRKLVTDLNKNIIFSSHILHDIETVCDDVVILSEGRLLKQGNLKELMREGSSMLTVRIRGDQDAFLRALESRGVKFEVGKFNISIEKTDSVVDNILNAAVESKVQLRNLDYSKNTLEELFINMIRNGGM
jgi:ABC-2 type transport system ATP-binding protein